MQVLMDTPSMVHCPILPVPQYFQVLAVRITLIKRSSNQIIIIIFVAVPSGTEIAVEKAIMPAYVFPARYPGPAGTDGHATNGK